MTIILYQASALSALCDRFNRNSSVDDVVQQLWCLLLLETPAAAAKQQPYCAPGTRHRVPGTAISSVFDAIYPSYAAAETRRTSVRRRYCLSY